MRRATVDTVREVEQAAIEQWSFGTEDAGRIGQSVLSVIGQESAQSSTRFIATVKARPRSGDAVLLVSAASLG